MYPRLGAEEAGNHERPTGMNINTSTKCSQVALVVKNPVANVGNIRDVGSIPESGRSPEEGMATHSSSCLENPMDRGASLVQSVRSQRVRHD